MKEFRSGQFCGYAAEKNSLSAVFTAVERNFDMAINRYSDYTTGWTSEEWGFDSRQGQEIFQFSITSRPALGPTQPSTQWLPGSVSMGIKPPGHEAYHPPSSSAEDKNDGAIPPLPLRLRGLLLNLSPEIATCYSAGCLRSVEVQRGF
jgi:hypothetical protein